MSNKRFNVDPIQWYEGMFMMPHHFQEADERYNDILAYHLETVFPYHWGVQSLRIDSSQLGQDRFRVEKLEAVFQTQL